MPTAAALIANQRIREELGLEPTPITKNIPSTLKRVVESNGGVPDSDLISAFHVKPAPLKVSDGRGGLKQLSSVAVEQHIADVLANTPRAKGVGFTFARDKNLGFVYAFFVHKNF
jgi:hypothetical protein